MDRHTAAGVTPTEPLAPALSFAIARVRGFGAAPRAIHHPCPAPPPVPRPQLLSAPQPPPCATRRLAPLWASPARAPALARARRSRGRRRRRRLQHRQPRRPGRSACGAWWAPCTAWPCSRSSQPGKKCSGSPGRRTRRRRRRGRESRPPPRCRWTGRCRPTSRRTERSRAAFRGWTSSAACLRVVTGTDRAPVIAARARCASPCGAPARTYSDWLPTSHTCFSHPVPARVRVAGQVRPPAARSHPGVGCFSGSAERDVAADRRGRRLLWWMDGPAARQQGQQRCCTIGSDAQGIRSSPLHLTRPQALGFAARCTRRGPRLSPHFWSSGKVDETTRSAARVKWKGVSARERATRARRVSPAPGAPCCARCGPRRRAGTWPTSSSGSTPSSLQEDVREGEGGLQPLAKRRRAHRCPRFQRARTRSPPPWTRRA